MKQIGGVWLPDHEKHLVEWMANRNEVVDGRLAYQYPKLRAALKWVKEWRTAVDVGAHCGLWSMHLVKHFNVLHAFEPIEAHRDCWLLNVPEIQKHPLTIQLHACALGETEGAVAMHSTQGSSGDSWVKGEGEIPLQRLDSLGLDEVDFIKLDCEGYELFALRGGEELLKRCRPCVIVEQKPGRAQKFGLPETGAVDYLRGLGATLRQEISGDFILSWD